MRVNEAIRAREVRLVSPDGEQLGIVPIKDALRVAMEKGFDLVEVAPSAKPPVCRIMDYGKYKYEMSKKEREARKKQKTVTVKEVKMRLSIEDHDFDVKMKNALRFLQDGDKVKVTIMFRGREIVHANLGKVLLDRMAQRLQDVSVVERPAKVEGRNMVMILTPRQN
ncbi:MAG: translation initiation factor IF-3 [Bacillota bacterium]